MIKNLLLFICLLILTPYFWWNISHPKKIILEISKFPQYIASQKTNLFSKDKIARLADARWYSINHTIGRVFFNKLFIIPDEFFYGLQTISPHNFYSTPGNQQSTPKDTPAIPFILLPYTLLGIYKLIKNKKSLPFCLLFISILIPIFTGQPTLYYLTPAFLLYLYFAYHQIKTLSKKHLFSILAIDLFYNLFIIGRLTTL